MVFQHSLWLANVLFQHGLFWKGDKRTDNLSGRPSEWEATGALRGECGPGWAWVGRHSNSELFKGRLGVTSVPSCRYPYKSSIQWVYIEYLIYSIYLYIYIQLPWVVVGLWAPTVRFFSCDWFLSKNPAFCTVRIQVGKNQSLGWVFEFLRM